MIVREHDHWHSLKVLNFAEKIAKTEKCNEYIVMIAALLHDADDIKLFETENYENARRIMSGCQHTEDTIDNVIDIIREISFKGMETTSPKSIEGKIVQDADRLDAMGAIGIADTSPGNQSSFLQSGCCFQSSPGQARAKKYHPARLLILPIALLGVHTCHYTPIRHKQS